MSVLVSVLVSVLASVLAIAYAAVIDYWVRDVFFTQHLTEKINIFRHHEQGERCCN